MVFLRAQYDWTTGVPDNGNEWRKFRAIPRLHPLRSLVCALFQIGGNRRGFRLRGEGGDHFHCTVERSPGHIRCRNSEKGVFTRGTLRKFDFVSYIRERVCEIVEKFVTNSKWEIRFGQFYAPFSEFLYKSSYKVTFGASLK